MKSDLLIAATQEIDRQERKLRRRQMMLDAFGGLLFALFLIALQVVYQAFGVMG